MTPKQIIRNFLKTMTHGKPGDLTKLVAPDLVASQGAKQTNGAAAAEAYAAHYRETFSNWTLEVERVIAEGSWVAVKGYTTGVISAALPDFPKPGTPVCIPWLAHYRIVRGKIAEIHMLGDTSSVEAGQPSSKIPLEPKVSV
ncbi:MAG: nuclear transport factor 2 family protein [Bryobacteraceae bacterium]